MRVLFYARGVEQLGVEYLMSYLQKKGHQVELIFDYGFDNNLYYRLDILKFMNKWDKLIQRAVDWKPDLVAFSSLTNIFPFALEFARRLKRHVDVPFVFGGIHPTVLPEYVLWYDEIDYVIRGEGEYPLEEFATTAPLSNQNLQKILELSVVILCYQTGEYVRVFTGEVIKNIAKLNVEYEIILVANYWDNFQDKTPQIAKELQRSNSCIKVVALPKKGMMGWDMTSGLKLAAGRVIVVIDGDGQMPPQDLVRVYKKLREGGFDFVQTYRIKREDGFWRRAVSIVYNIIFHLLFPGLSVHDVNSKPKIFTREVYEKINLTSVGWFIDAEIMIQARRLHLKIGEIPTIFKRIENRCSYVKVGTIWEFIKNLVKARLNEFMAKR